MSVARYKKIVVPVRADLQCALSEYAIAWTIFPSDHPIVWMLDREPGWRRLVDQDGLVIQARGQSAQ